MVKLVCAIVGVAGSAFPVDIDASQLVGDLKKVIKAEKPNDLKDVDADKLQLFLAKTESGAWLPDDDALDKMLQTEVDTSKMKKLRPSGRLNNADLFGPDVSLGDNVIHVLVVVLPAPLMMPTLSQQSFFWKKPKSLVGTIGAKWDFQNSLNLGNLAFDIGCHYQAWRDGKTDKQSHPLFVCLDGPGTGKSRLLDEFPNILQQQIHCDEKQGGRAIKQLLQTAYTFKITFENGTTDNYGISDPAKMIGTRMLYQLHDSADWMTFRGNPANQVFPGEVMKKLSEITESDLNRMCVILCVDSLQKLQHEPGRKDSNFYAAFASLCDLVNASKCWVIAICAATIYQPVNEFLAASPQWRVMLQTTPLERPKINGRDVFDAFNDSNGVLTQLLVDDMGGHGRALETLFKVMQKQGQPFEFIPVMHNVLNAIRQAYPAIVTEMQSMMEAFLAVISRRSVDGHSRFGNLTLDQVISCGLIRLDGTHLQCSFVLYMLLETNDIPWNKHATWAPAERWEDLKPWQLWEQFNCKFRALKSEAFSQKEPVLWTDIHYAARFGDGCNRHVIERQLTYALAAKWMTTKTKGFKKGRCSCGNDRGLYQPANGCPSGDAFLCLEDATKGFFHEVHQYKCVEKKISLDIFEQEKSKAAGPDDLFILYSTSEVTADLRMPPNSAFVGSTCWKEYYGPFAARAFFTKSVPLPCINTCSAVQLEFVKGVGPSYRYRIATKRPFASLHDALERTKIPAKVLKRFHFETDSR